MISPFSDTGLMAAGGAGSRYATSWFPALSSSCSWMMLERPKMARLFVAGEEQGEPPRVREVLLFLAARGLRSRV